MTPKVYFYSNSADTPPGCGVNEEGMPVGCDYLAGETNCVRSLSNFCIRVAAVRVAGHTRRACAVATRWAHPRVPRIGVSGGAMWRSVETSRCTHVFHEDDGRLAHMIEAASSHLIVIVIIVVSRALAANAVHIDGGH